jgi:hypothetical protein
MKTFSKQISKFGKRTRDDERRSTRRIVEGMLPDLEGKKWQQAVRIIRKLNKNGLPTQVTRGPYSGMTRLELAKSRTCETDWF